VDSRRIRNRSCKGDSDGGAGGGLSVMATSGMVSVVFLGLTWFVSARRGGKCRGYKLRCTSFAFRWLRHGSRESSRRRGALEMGELV